MSNSLHPTIISILVAAYITTAGASCFKSHTAFVSLYDCHAKLSASVNPSVFPTLPYALSQHREQFPVVLFSSPEPKEESAVDDESDELTAEEEAKIGNLVANEEWDGLSMELAEIVRTAVIEDVKKNSREFLGTEAYTMGDFSKEIDRRVKSEVASIRGKEDYELGDFSVVLDDRVKSMVCELTGNDEYSFGDLSTEIDERSKVLVAEFCGKESYEFGDLSEEIAKRTKKGVLKFTGRNDYKFGDITKQAFKNFTGDDEYQFGDLSKKLFGNMFGKKSDSGK